MSYRRRWSTGEKVLAAAAGAVILSAAGHTPATKALLTSARTPAGGYYTPASWAGALLAAEGLPATSCNRAAVRAWETAEGGHWANSARFNPLDTTMPEPGSYGMNSVGVQAYPSWRSGFRATIATLSNGRYPGILAALRAGGDAQAVADAVAASPWGTGPFQASC